MAKRNVVEIVCERCDRVEYVKPDEYQEEPDLVITCGGKTVTFEDLCSSCKKTVGNLADQITKKISWKRNKDEDKKEEDSLKPSPSPDAGTRYS